MTTAGMTYRQRRAAAIALAAAYDGWGRPPTPEGTPARWRTVWLDRTYGRKRFRVDGKWEWGEGLRSHSAVVPNTLLLDAAQAAKERLQNRTHFA